MAKPKKEEPAKPDVAPKEDEDIEEEVVEPTPVVVKEDSPAKKKFRDLIAAYKIQNPVKYAQKEKSLLAQLDKMQ